MQRDAVKIHANNHSTTILLVDAAHIEEIFNYIFEDNVLKEFLEIKYLLFANLRNKEKYCKASVSDKAKNVFEMRFTNKGKNDRIYCTEHSKGAKRYIIMTELFEGKKTQDIPKRIKSRLEIIGGYKYEL